MSILQNNKSENPTRKIQLRSKFIYAGTTLEHLVLEGGKFFAQNESGRPYLLNFFFKKKATPILNKA